MLDSEFKGSRSHLQPALNIFKFGMNEEYNILMTCMNFKSCRLSNILIRYQNLGSIFLPISIHVQWGTFKVYIEHILEFKNHNIC